MDLASIIGLVLAAGMVLFSMIIGGNGIAIFLHFPSLALVLGGSFAAIMIANSLKRVMLIPKYIGIIFHKEDYPISKTISQIVTFSDKARRDGLLSLEDELDNIEDPYFRDGLELVVDGTDPEIIKRILLHELNCLQERHEVGVKLFATWGTLAPAFGMIGTLAGLISMLAHLQDTAGIGRGMSLALITTLYGTMLANMIIIPFRTKLQDKDREETLLKEIIIEGILSIQCGDNPMIVEAKLLTFVSPATRDKVISEVKAELDYRLIEST